MKPWYHLSYWRQHSRSPLHLFKNVAKKKRAKLPNIFKSIIKTCVWHIHIMHNYTITAIDVNNSTVLSELQWTQALWVLQFVWITVYSKTMKEFESVMKRNLKKIWIFWCSWYMRLKLETKVLSGRRNKTWSFSDTDDSVPPFSGRVWEDRFHRTCCSSFFFLKVLLHGHFG